MLSLIFTAGIATAGGAMPSAHAGQLEALSWLAGCWADPVAEPGSGEFWQPLAGNTLLGVGRTVKGGRTVSYEFLRLHEDPQGRAVYTALPSGQKETSFVAVEVGLGAASFENLQHDFPQRITYQRTGDTSLVVRIEGERQGARRAVEFRFVRQACAR